MKEEELLIESLQERKLKEKQSIINAKAKANIRQEVRLVQKRNYIKW